MKTEHPANSTNSAAAACCQECSVATCVLARPAAPDPTYARRPTDSPHLSLPAGSRMPGNNLSRAWEPASVQPDICAVCGQGGAGRQRQMARCGAAAPPASWCARWPRHRPLILITHLAPATTSFPAAHSPGSSPNLTSSHTPLQAMAPRGTPGRLVAVLSISMLIGGASARCPSAACTVRGCAATLQIFSFPFPARALDGWGMQRTAGGTGRRLRRLEAGASPPTAGTPVDRSCLLPAPCCPFCSRAGGAQDAKVRGEPVRARHLGPRWHGRGAAVPQVRRRRRQVRRVLLLYRQDRCRRLRQVQGQGRPGQLLLLVQGVYPRGGRCEMCPLKDWCEAGRGGELRGGRVRR